MGEKERLPVKALQGNYSLGAPAAAFGSLQGQTLLAAEGENPTDGQTQLRDETFGPSDLWRGGCGGKASVTKAAEPVFPPSAPLGCASPITKSVPRRKDIVAGDPHFCGGNT